MEYNNFLELLNYIQPSSLDYQEWINVGMALKHEGFSADVWDDWSKADRRYKPGECYRKWNTFTGTSSPVTGGTIYQLAVDAGWKPEKTSHELNWDDEIDKDYQIVEKEWVEGIEIKEPDIWNPVNDLIKYLEILFDSTENVGYVTEVWEKDGKYMPSKGNYDRTAGQLIEQLSKCDGDIGAVLGD